MATTQETLQIKSIVPSFTVDDLQKSITFYEGLGSLSTSDGRTTERCSA